MANRIVIGLPLYGVVQADWFQKFMRFQAQVATFTQAHRQDYAGIITTVTPYISMAMNQIVVEALQSDRWDYMLVIEQDMILPDGLMDRISEYDPEKHPIVGVLYFGRVKDDQRPVVGHFKSWKKFERINDEELDGMLKEPGLYPIDWVAMGCTIIHRKVFESWNPKKMPWFKTPEGTKGAMGHDVHFCTEAKRLGFPIHVDTKIVAGHQGLWTSTLETYLATRTYNSNIWADWNPVEIQTAMTRDELQKLGELAKDNRVLEIGAWAGASTVAMGRAAEVVFSVDWHRQDKWHEVVGSQGDTLSGFRATVAFNGLQDKVVPLVGRSQDVLPTLSSAQFDMIFIDGDHSYEGVHYDLTEAQRLLKPGGVIALHDYKREELMPEYKDGEYKLGVTQVIDELGVPFERVDSLVILRPDARPVVLQGTGG